MLYDVMVFVVGIAFVAGVVLLWRPGSIDTPRWYGAVAIGLAIVLANVMPDYSKDVKAVRTPSSEMVVRMGPSPSADTAQEVSSVEPGDELHVVSDTAGWVGFRDVADDPTWTGYVPKEQTLAMATYEERQARQDSLEEVRQERAAERRASRVSKAGALNACEGFIKKKLKAPSTAEFGWASDAQYTRHDRTTMTVRSHVDAENAMGAKLRSEYRCKVTRDGDTWKLLDLAMSQR